MVKVEYTDHKNGKATLEISSKRTDGAVTGTIWENMDKEVVLRNAHSNLNEFKNALDRQTETKADLEARIPRMQAQIKDLEETSIPNLTEAIVQLEKYIPEGYSPTE